MFNRRSRLPLRAQSGRFAQLTLIDRPMSGEMEKIRKKLDEFEEKKWTRLSVPKALLAPEPTRERLSAHRIRMQGNRRIADLSSGSPQTLSACLLFLAQIS